MSCVWKLAVVLLMVALAVLTYRVATRTSDERLAEAVAAAQFAQCQRGNAVRAWIRLDALRNAAEPVRRAARADRLFPILDCEATVEQSATVPLSVPAQLEEIARIDRQADGR